MEPGEGAAMTATIPLGYALKARPYIHRYIPLFRTPLYQRPAHIFLGRGEGELAAPQELRADERSDDGEDEDDAEAAGAGAWLDLAAAGEVRRAVHRFVPGDGRGIPAYTLQRQGGEVLGFK